MQVTQINHVNFKDERPSFKALKKISCFQGDLFSNCHLNEERIVDELKKIVNNDNFFKKNDVNAFVRAFRGVSSLTLEYKPVAKNFKEKIQQFFMPAKKIELIKTAFCTDDSTFYLAKEMRKIKTFEDYAKSS